MFRYNTIILSWITIIGVLSFSYSIHANISPLPGEAEAEIRYEVLTSEKQVVRTDRKETIAKDKKAFQDLHLFDVTQTYKSPVLVIKRHVWTQTFLL